MLKKVLYSLIIFVLAELLVVYFVGFNEVFASMTKFSILYIFYAVLFVLLSVFVEFIRWHYYLIKVKIKISWKKSLMIFLSGYSLGFFPAKSGELLRQYILKKHSVPYTKSVPFHFISNIAGLVIAILFCLPLLISIGQIKIFYVIFISVIFLYLSLRFPALYIVILNFFFKKTKFKIIISVKKILKYTKEIIDFKLLFISFSLTLLYFCILGIGLYILLLNTGFHNYFFYVFAVYCFSLILGVISTLPGGIGVVEISSIGLLSGIMGAPTAMALIIIMRILTLGLTISIGFVALNIDYKTLFKIKKNHF